MQTYLIQVQGMVDVDELNSFSPLAMTFIQFEADATLFSIFTDQSGLVGMLRHLHNLGFILLSVGSQPREAAQ